MDPRTIAANVLKVGAWLSLLGGTVLFAALLIAEPDPALLRGDDVYDPLALQQKRQAENMLTAGAWGSLLGGVFAWAFCIVGAHVSDESREMHHIIDKLTKG